MDLAEIVKLIPNGIVLMFPNYDTMELAFNIWKYLFMKKGIKSFKESRNKAESKNTIAEYF